ncbi:glycosyltransferase [bacterium]|nr:glycosyltransferase [bacterium]
MDWRSLSPRWIENVDYPLVSIITPSYNQSQFLEETIRSVLLQGYPNLEYLIIDGGSNDGSVELVNRYAPWLAYWHSKRDRGQADAINQGIDLSNGEILGWLNSDDCLAIDSLSSSIPVFQRKPKVDFLYGDVEIIDTFSEVKGLRPGAKSSFTEMLRTLRVPIPQPGSLWRQVVCDRIGKLDSRWQVVLDREFFLRVSLACEIEYLPKTLARFRHHSDAKSTAFRKKWIEEIPLMYAEFFARKDLPSSIYQLKRETMSSAHLYCARIAYAENARIMFYLCYLRAFLSNPCIFANFIHKRSKLHGVI